MRITPDVSSVSPSPTRTNAVLTGLVFIVFLTGQFDNVNYRAVPCIAPVYTLIGLTTVPLLVSCGASTFKGRGGQQIVNRG